MTKPKRARGDLNVTAFQTLQAVTGAEQGNPKPILALDDAEYRRQIMREMGRRGGQKGGKARAESLSAKRRKEIAKAAAVARWENELRDPRD
jgi:hypothetical protein